MLVEGGAQSAKRNSALMNSDLEDTFHQDAPSSSRDGKRLLEERTLNLQMQITQLDNEINQLSDNLQCAIDAHE